MAIGGCTGDDADLLRRAMGSKRGVEKIERLRDNLYEGMAAHGITGEEADDIYARIQAFANFGFAESHAISFALLVYASLLAEAALSGRLSGRAATGAADGLLLPAVPGGRRPPARCSCAPAGYRPVRGRCRSRITGVKRHRSHPHHRHGLLPGTHTTQGRRIRSQCPRPDLDPSPGWQLRRPARVDRGPGNRP